MPIIKNDIEVEDIRLARVPEFDERSRGFSIGTAVAAKKPRSYTWRCNEFYDQGREGACVAYALGHELVARPAEVLGTINDKWLVQKVYWEAQRNDPWAGGSYPGATPFYEGTSVLAGVKVLHKMKLFESYRWAFTFNDLILGLGHNGPAVLGLNWYEGMFATDSKGFIRPTGKILGGHAVLARGVNVSNQTVTIRNSWGKSWGKGGDCYITFADLERLMKERGEAVFLQKRTALFHEAKFVV
jgi:hypothetical protein